MNPKTNSAARVSALESALQCPLCGSPVRVAAPQSLICTQNHNFDFARQGYLNLTTRPFGGNYTKELFQARRKIITECGLYAAMHEAIAGVIKEYRGASRDPVHCEPIHIADLGCGEGSHLQRIMENCGAQILTGIGLDLSKEGIAMAARTYRDHVWLVGDLANSPLAGEAVHAVLNILSPSNYKEFKRIAVPGGLIIKVVPGPGYLKEMREALFGREAGRRQPNDGTEALFNKHFHLPRKLHLGHTQRLNREELGLLVRMTPLAWTADKERIDGYINRATAEITVDLDILIGVNKRGGEE